MNHNSIVCISGAVRVESFTRLPPVMHPASMTDSQMIEDRSGNTDCPPASTAEENEDNEENGKELEI